MKAVILAGGLGTRMREETEFRPKPMVEIGGKPVLWHIMKNISHFGIRDFVICLGYKGEVIADYFSNENAGENFDQDWKVELAETGLDTLTGGRILKAQEYIGTEDFICTYGDGLANVDISLLLKRHKEHSGIATVTAVNPRSRFGLLDISTEGQVKNFEEKPLLNEWINGGFFVFRKEIFNYLDLKTPLETSPLTALARNGNLHAYKHLGFWQPMDTYREYLEMNELWENNQAPWKQWND
jgi:glucose-1-phosphate cytidylyltransferase